MHQSGTKEARQLIFETVEQKKAHTGDCDGIHHHFPKHN